LRTDLVQSPGLSDSLGELGKGFGRVECLQVLLEAGREWQDPSVGTTRSARENEPEYDDM
jgi:hypothetical protein